MLGRELAAAGPIRAAGGVVWRAGDSGVEVCLVHRPRYDDWSLPKGKLEAGEHPLIAAVREVAEEADVQGVPQVRLAQARYVTRDGCDKTVDYWSMRAVTSGGFLVDTEVDAVRWLSVAAAVRLASYEHDVRVLRDFAALPLVTAVLALVGNGDAVARDGRPDEAVLSDAGVGQARAWAPVLALLRPRLLLADPSRCCAQTLRPLGDLLGLPGIDQDSFPTDPVAGAARLVSLASAGTPAVVCGRPEVIPLILAQLTAGRAEDYPTESGSGWLLAFSGDRLVAADRLTAT